jgi:hypothetical protein
VFSLPKIDLPSKAVSFEDADEARQRKGGAFMRHKKNGHFILAIESGRHTDPASGNVATVSWTQLAQKEQTQLAFSFS